MKNKNPAVIYGILREPNGLPIAEARVSFIDGPVSLPDIALLTDSDGKFTLLAPVEGTYWIGCSADGFESARITVNNIGGKEIKVEIKLSK